MLKYVTLRVLAAIPVVGFVAILVFMLVHIAPGDPATLMAGETATPEQIAKIRTDLGLDRPLLEQFFTWVWGLLQLDLGRSIFTDLPISTLIAQRLEPTLVLTVTSIFLTVMIAVPAGVLAAWKSNTIFDRLVMLFSVMGFSVPAFLIGYMLMYIFAIELRWLPVQGYKSLSEGLIPCLRSVTLPSVTIAMVFAALVARVTRASMVEVLGEDYIRTARAKGLGELRIVLLHALKNAGVPIVTVIGVGVAILIGGVVVTESVFNIPGLGRLTVDAIVQRDFPLVQGMLIFFSAMLVSVNLVVDLSYALFDPRIRYGK